MPDSYVNPNNKPPPPGGYQWVPSTPPTGGAVPIGYRPMTLERGQFRNDLPVADGFSDGTLKIEFAGERVSLEGSEAWPVLNAFRPLQRPSSVRGAAPVDPFVVRGADWKWSAELTQDARLSAVTLTYSLIVNVRDDSIFDLIARDSEDGQAILAYRSNPSQPLNVDWSKYKWGQVKADDTEIPALVDNKPVQLAVTGIEVNTAGYVDATASVTIKLGDSTLPNSYPLRKRLSILNRHALPALKFALHKILLFNAVQTNVPNSQLPCSLLGYAFPLFFNYDPSRGTLVHPNNLTTPNLHVKLFHPEALTNSPGFAHSISARFMLFSMPISGIDPFSFFGNPSPFSLYFVVFIGPVPGKRNLRYSLYGRYVNGTTGRVVTLDYYKLQANVQSIRLQKVSSDSQPSAGAAWATVANGEYDPKAPPAFDPIQGPWLRDYTYFDADGNTKSWYRVVQTLQTGSQVIGQSFQGSLFSERFPLRMVDSPSGSSNPDTTSLVRRAQIDSDKTPLASQPLAVFVASDEERPPADPVKFVKGAWKLSLRARSDDPNAHADTHLFARIWFVPENHTVSATNIHEYRDRTELCFQTSNGQTTLVRRAPQSLSEVIVSPPLPQALSYLELARYIDTDATFSFGLGTRAKMVVGIYSLCSLNEDGKAAKIDNASLVVPKITLDVNAQTMAVETTLQQTLSYALYPQKASNFSASRYTAYARPLLASNRLVGGSSLPASENSYTEYSRTFKSNTGTEQVTENAFRQLVTLLKSDSSTVPGKVAIPFEKIPNKRDINTFVAADVVTNGASLQAGRIDAGTWSLALRAHRSVDSPRVAIDVRFEALLVTSDGRVSERVFRSPIIQDPGEEETDYSYKLDIQVPFLISNADIQLVLRVYAYPYSRDGLTVDITRLKADLKKQDGNIPLGLRIQELNLLEHTVNQLEIDQVDSVLGSPAFYEDLPLVPPRSLGAQDFWFIAANDLLTSQIVSAQNGLDVTGCLYSPTWFVDLPEEMEVRSGAQGFRDRTVWFRTVLSAGGTSTSEFGISAVEDPMTGRVHVASDEAAGVSGQSIRMLNDTGKVIRHYSLDTPYAPVFENTIVQGPNGLGVKDFEGKNPSLIFLPGTYGKQPSSIIGLVAQADEIESPSFNVAINSRSGLPGSWTGPNRELGEAAFGSVRRITQGMVNPSVAVSDNGVTVYAAGWVNPGTIVVRQTNVFDAGRQSQLADGTNFIIDGDANITLGSGQTAVLPDGSLLGKAVQTFPALMMDDRGILTVAYTIEGESGKLFARRFDGYRVGRPHLIVNMRAQGTSGSDALSIFAPALAWNQDTHSGYVAWWCSGKIFLASVSALVSEEVGVQLSPIQLVAGNREFTSSGNSGHAAFIALQNAGNLIVDQAGNPEPDVPRQRVGLFVSRKFPHQGKLFVWYRDSENRLRMREVTRGGMVSAPVTLS